MEHPAHRGAIGTAAEYPHLHRLARIRRMGRLVAVRTLRGVLMYRPGILLAVAALLLSGCFGFNDLGPVGPEDPAPPTPRADVETLARQRFDTIAQLAGGGLADWETRTSTCKLKTGSFAQDGRWTMTANATVNLPENKHEAALRALHDKWQADGWQIFSDADKPDRRLLGGTDPQAAFNISLTAYKEAPRIWVTLNAPCYRRVQGEDPANG